MAVYLQPKKFSSEKECEVNDEIEGLSLHMAQVNLESDEKNVGSSKDIPDFWLTVIKMVPQMDQMIQEYDEPILKHLTDVRIRSQTEPCLSFTLEFHFSPNEYFENDVLTKQYFMECVPEGDPFVFDGPEIYMSKGIEIKWKDEKNVTVRQMDGQEMEGKIQSFFNFFAPPELVEDPNHPMFQEIKSVLEADFEIGFSLKNCVFRVKERECGSLDTTISNSLVDSSVEEHIEELESDDKVGDDAP